MTTAITRPLIVFGDPRLPDNFWRHVEIQPSGCWLWTGAIQGRGYGSAWDPKECRTKLAHRFLFESVVGPLDPDVELDHLCHTRDLSCPGGVGDLHRLCVNLADLEPVDGATNNRRGRSPWAVNGRRTHCVHGHEFTKANTRVRPDGRRQCRTCDAALYAAKQAERLAASTP